MSTAIKRIFCHRFHANICSNILVRNLKTAVIGSGPAGFYLTQYLIKNCKESTVDIYEKYPVPFGLVRFGVAPDHPEVKNVIHSFTTTAESDRVKFYGNISIGTDVTLAELRSAYDAVVLCYGSSKDRSLGIPGEWDHRNIVSARSFVGWYNGVPSDKDLDIDLNCGDTAIIIGHGNVALDCARILLTPVSPNLTKTDITSHSAEKLANASIRRVFVIGRRGPIQAAFTIKELREMTKISNCRTLIDTSATDFISASELEKLPRARKRLTQLMVDISKGLKNQTVESDSKECRIQFLKSPLSIESNFGAKNNLSVKFCTNMLDNPMNEKSPCLPKEEFDTINCGLILKSIGYQTINLDPSVPMNEKKGCIDNIGGRVKGHTGLYCSGWSATGPSGVLVNTMNVSFEVGSNIVQDWKSGLLKRDLVNNNLMNPLDIVNLLKSRNVEIVTFDDWKNIDKTELSMGSKLGKPREKLVKITDMVNAAKNKKF